jgi:3-dehydroquinate synthase
MSDFELGYPIVTRSGSLKNVASYIKSSGNKVGIIHPSQTLNWATRMAKTLIETGRDARLFEIPAGEAAKELGVAAQVWASLTEFGFSRQDTLISVGGGAATDLAGFVAGTWMRGVDVIHCPTTLLAMVDASVGGKTGINTDQAKNLVGVFHDPIAVLCDSETLATLPELELRSGFAEIIKAGLIGDETILSQIEQATVSDLTNSDVLDGLIYRAIAVKAAVVASDPRELEANGVGRAALNYGHTFGHAIEKYENYQLRHGEAISIGMTFAAALGVAAGITPREISEKQAFLLSKMGLPITYHGGTLEQVLKIARLDKKNRASLLRFIVLRGAGQVEFLEAPSDALVEQAWHRIQS